MRAETARIDTASIAATTKRLDRNEGNSYPIGRRCYEQPSRHSLRHERSQGTTPHLVIHSGVSGILITATTPLAGLEGCWIGSPINLGITSLFSSRKQLLATDTDTGDEEEGPTPTNSNQLQSTPINSIDYSLLLQLSGTVWVYIPSPLNTEGSGVHSLKRSRGHGGSLELSGPGVGTQV